MSKKDQSPVDQVTQAKNQNSESVELTVTLSLFVAILQTVSSGRVYSNINGSVTCWRIRTELTIEKQYLADWGSIYQTFWLVSVPLHNILNKKLEFSKIWQAAIFDGWLFSYFNSKKQSIQYFLLLLAKLNKMKNFIVLTCQKNSFYDCFYN